MRRILATAAVAAVITAVIVGPLATSAAGPYTYSCTPAAPWFGSTIESRVSLYNAQTATANVTAKLLANNGTNLNTTFGVTTTFTIAPGATRWIKWTNPENQDPSTSNSIPSNVRIVSDQGLGVGITFGDGTLNASRFMCSYVHP